MRVGKKSRSMIMAGTLALAATVTGGSALVSSATAAPDGGCRTYSSATACGEIKLTTEQSTCVARSVDLGMTERRAEVECSRLP
ncbi:hypothetical protein [Actinocorallia aurantiaca]|jgi:hypothetical protein|uniref:DUF3551 domain-containing protein n=1 Tax=Actinocorallia aurantiaca TaxID=46204 RepID=A0ABN3TX94_9ACTN